VTVGKADRLHRPNLVGSLADGQRHLARRE
jgi:hypothetical protein